MPANIEQIRAEIETALPDAVLSSDAITLIIKAIHAESLTQAFCCLYISGGKYNDWVNEDATQKPGINLPENTRFIVTKEENNISFYTRQQTAAGTYLISPVKTWDDINNTLADLLDPEEAKERQEMLTIEEILKTHLEKNEMMYSILSRDGKRFFDDVFEMAQPVQEGVSGMVTCSIDELTTAIPPVAKSLPDPTPTHHDKLTASYGYFFHSALRAPLLPYSLAFKGLFNLSTGPSAHAPGKPNGKLFIAGAVAIAVLTLIPVMPGLCLLTAVLAAAAAALAAASTLIAYPIAWGRDRFEDNSTPAPAM